MNSTHVRLAAVGAAGALAAITAVGFAGASSAATGVATLADGVAQPSSAHHVSQGAAGEVTVTATPGSCAHVPAGKLSSVVTFHPRSLSGAATYRVQMLDPSSEQPLQTRAVRIGPGAPSTLNIVWQQRKAGPGTVNLRIIDARGAQATAVHEHATGPLVAARCDG